MHILIAIGAVALIVVWWWHRHQERRRLAMIRRGVQMARPDLTREQVEAEVALHRTPSLRQLNRANRNHYRQQEPSPWPREALAWHPTCTDYIAVATIISGIFVVLFIALVLAPH